MHWRRLAVVFVILAAILGGLLLFDAPQTPKGQPALQSLTAANVSDFQRAFDSASDQTRVVVLVSPT